VREQLAAVRSTSDQKGGITTALTDCNVADRPRERERR
jgi:hypothetical protein